MRANVDYWNKTYAAETGIRVEQMDWSRVGYVETCNTILAGGTPTPDIVHIQQINMAFTASQHLTEPLDKYIEDKDLFLYDWNDHVTGARESCTFEGERIALPFDSSVYAMVYRKDLMADPPETLEDWKEEARRWTQKLNPDSPTKYGSTIGVGKPKTGLSFEVFIPMVKAFGGDWFDEEWRPVFNEGPGQEVVKYLKSFLDEELTPPNWYEIEYVETDALIKRGDVALTPHWNAAYAGLTNPDESPLVYDKVAFSPWPGMKLDTTISRYHCTSIHMVSLNPYSLNKEAAFRFMAWTTSSPEAQKIYTDVAGMPTLSKVFDDPEVAEKHPWFPMLKDIVVESPMHWPPLPEFLSICIEILDPWLAEAYFGRMSAKEALDKAADETYKYLEAHGYYG